MRKLGDWLFTVVIAEELKPKIPLPTDELPKVLLLRLLMPAPCLLLVSGGSKPEDDTGKSADVRGGDPNLEKEVAKDEDATTGLEELLLLDAIVTGMIVGMLLPVESAVALLPLLGGADELLNIFLLVKLFDKGGKEEENEGLEIRDPLL